VRGGEGRESCVGRGFGGGEGPRRGRDWLGVVWEVLRAVRGVEAFLFSF